MFEIAEKLEFTKVRVVKVCAKARIGRKAEHKNPGILVNLQKMPFKRKSSTFQGDFGKIIDIVMRKLCCLRVYLGNLG